MPTTMRQIDITPRLSRPKEQAIEQLSYFDGIRSGTSTEPWTRGAFAVYHPGPLTTAARDVLNATGQTWTEQTGHSR